MKDTDAYSPIKTYNNQGCTKRGIDPDQHGIIFTGYSEPAPLPNEGQFRKKAIRMVPVNPEENLDITSRINYGRPTPVEHNLRVKHIGQIDPVSMYRLFRYYDEENSTDGIKVLEKRHTPHHRASRSRHSSDRRSRSIGGQYDNDDEQAFQQEGEDDFEEYTSGRRPSTHERRLSTTLNTPVIGTSVVGSPSSLIDPRTGAGRQSFQMEGQTRRERSRTDATSRSSPVPFGTQRVITHNQRRMTEGETDLLPLESHGHRHDSDRHKRKDGYHRKR
jgi:hypothetical protein